MADVGGTLAFDDVAWPGELWPDVLPPFIPQVDGSQVGDLDAQLRWPAFGVGLRRVLSPDTFTIYPRWRDTTAHDALGLDPRAQKAVLVGYGEDPLVEAYWTRRHADHIVDQLADHRWDLILAPNFSVYGNWPRVEHLLNMRRSLLAAAELAERGIAVAPNVYWYRLEDLQRWVEWITDVQPPAIGCNLQTVRENTNWSSWAEPGLYWLAENLPPTVRIVLTGLSRADRIATAVDLFGDRLILVSQNPHQYALHGAVIGPTGRQDVHARVPDAFASSVRYMASLLASGRDEPGKGAEF